MSQFGVSATTKVLVSADYGQRIEKESEQLPYLKNTVYYDPVPAKEVQPLIYNRVNVGEPNHKLGYKFVVDRNKITLDPTQAQEVKLPTPSLVSRIAVADNPGRLYTN
jgi:hypothetical protein